MIDGTSQGLNIVIAIVIFGIFVVIAYMLFGDKMKTGLASIFDDSISMVTDSIEYKKGEDIEGVTIENITDMSKIKDVDSNTLIVKIRDKGTDSNGEYTDVYIKLEKDSNGYKIIAVGNTDKVTGSSSIYGGSLSIPNSVNNVPIYSIGNVTKSSSDENVEGIFQNAKFKGTLTLPRDLQFIGVNSFRDSEFTGDFISPTNMWGIQTRAFVSSKFSGVFNVSDNLKILGSYAFASSNFTGTLTLPDTLSILNEGALRDSIFTGTLNLPDTMTYIGAYSLLNSKFTGSLIMPDVLTSLGAQSFQKSEFTIDLHISNKLNIIYLNTFDNSNFTKVTGGKNLSSMSILEGNFEQSKGIIVNNIDYKTIDNLKTIIQ